MSEILANMAAMAAAPEPFVLLAIVAILAPTLFWVFNRAFRGASPNLDHIPGPLGLPILGNSLEVKMEQVRNKFTEWSKIHGPVYRVRLPMGDVVVVSGHDATFEALNSNSVATGGKYTNFRQDFYAEKTGIVFNKEPDAKWQILRKVAQRHVKQFGDGIARIEHVIFEFSKDIFEKYNAAAESGKNLDPQEAIRVAALRIIIYMIVGEKVTEETRLYQLMKKLEPLIWKTLTLGAKEYFWIDTMPLLYYLPSRPRRVIQEMLKVKEDVIQEMHKYASTEDNMLGSLLELKDKKGFSVRDAELSSVNMVIAGLSTTSNTFSVFLNALTQHPKVQDKIFEEISRVVPPKEENVTLEHRPLLHYTRAALFEGLRYYMVGPVLPHLVVQDVTIAGIFIPKGTTLMLNLWSVHTDKTYWGDPRVFRPERFLNEDGTLVQPDHPHRRRLRNFAAGARACLGEQMAMARLFIWTANIMRRFKLSPGENCTPASLDIDTYVDSLQLQPPRYKVFFGKRPQC